VQSLEASKAMWHGNLPTYVKSVTYGTIVVFNMRKRLTKEELKAKVDAHAGIGAGSVDLSVAYNNMRSDSSTQVTFTTIGGPGDGAIKTATSRDFNNLFGRVPTAAEMRPISYTMRSVKENALAAMSRFTEYTYTEYAPNPIGQKYRMSIHAVIDASDDGFADNTLECYGELRINNDLWWAIDRSRSSLYKREKGQTIEISADNQPNKKNNFEFDFYYDKNTPFSFSLSLTDDDGGSNDDLIGRFSNNLTKDLIGNKGSTDVLEYKWNWNSGHSEATTIFVKLEPIGFL
jgi:Thiol-activated cytolysin